MMRLGLSVRSEFVNIESFWVGWVFLGRMGLFLRAGLVDVGLDWGELF